MDQEYTKSTLLTSKQEAAKELAKVFGVNNPLPFHVDTVYGTKLAYDKEEPKPSVFDGVLNITTTFAFHKSEETSITYTLTIDPTTATAVGKFFSATPTETISIFASDVNDDYIYLWGELQFASSFSKYLPYLTLFQDAGIEMSTIDPRHMWLIRIPSDLSYIDVMRAAYGLRRKYDNDAAFKASIKSYWDWKIGIDNNTIASAFSDFAGGNPFYLENAADGRWEKLLNELSYYTDMGGAVTETALNNYLNQFLTHNFVIDGHCAAVRNANESTSPPPP